MRSFRKCVAYVVAAIAGWHATSAASEEVDPSSWIADCGGAYNLCGYVERDSRKQRIPRKYEHVTNFSEGVAGVRIDGKYGFIDRRGVIVIAPRFDLVGEFRGGHAEALVGNRVGLIDRQGVWRLKPEHARAIPFGKTAALVLSGSWRSPYAMGYERHLTGYSSPQDGARTFALVDLSSGVEIRKGLTIEKFDDQAYVWARRDGDEGFGLLAPDGSWKIEPRYASVRPLWNGRALVCISGEENTGLRPAPVQCGSVDESGNPALPMTPHDVNGYSDGVYRFFNETRQVGLLNEAGKLIGSRLFDQVDFLATSTVFRVRERDQWFGLTREGEIVKDPKYGKVLSSCGSGLKFVARDAGFEIIKDGEATTPYVFDSGYLETNCEFPSYVTLDDKFSFVDANGKLLFDPPYFDNTYSFRQGYAAVRANGKWGIIDVKGRFTVALRYDKLMPDEEGLYAVKLDKDEFWINGRGERRPEPYRADKRREALACGEDGGAAISKVIDGRRLWGLADRDGRILIEPKYRAISCFRGGLAWVPFDDRKEWCAIDRNERRRETMACVKNWIAMQIFDAGPEKMSDDPYESGVLWMRAELDYGLGVRDQRPRTVATNRITF